MLLYFLFHPLNVMDVYHKEDFYQWCGVFVSICARAFVVCPFIVLL